MYAWGEGYSTLPMKLIFSEKVVDISGNLLLTESGKVYNTADLTTPIQGLKNIARISSGTNHSLALSVYGVLYSWGTNTYGECGVATTGNLAVQEIAYTIYDISAGNQISIIKSDIEDMYVFGNNAQGQLGLGTTANATTLTKVELSENAVVENISAGEGTHSGLVDKDGFVWHTGINTNGELGSENNTNKNIFGKTGEAIVLTNFDKKYLDIGESETIVAKLKNAFNLKREAGDENQDNFSIDLGGNAILSANKLTITAINYGTNIIKVVHTPTGKSKEITITVAMKMESIVQGFRDADLTDRRICSSCKWTRIYSRTNKYIWRHKIFIRRRSNYKNSKLR